MEKSENQKICGASWLHSKQDSQSLEKLKLFEAHYKNMDGLLKYKVAEQVKNNRTHSGRLLYKTKDCYIDNMNFNEFICSVIDCAGRDKLIDGIDKAIKIILKNNKDLKDKYTRKDIEKAIKIYMYYQPYIGYAFEQYIRDLIKSDDNYEIYTSDTLDLKYAIDMQVLSKKHNKVIGLQLKTFSFLNLSIDDRKEYKFKNTQAIREKWCNDVYYVFHSHNGNLLSNNYMALTHYIEACKSIDNFIVLEEEKWFIKELHEAFERVEKVEENRNLW